MGPDFAKTALLGFDETSRLGAIRRRHRKKGRVMKRIWVIALVGGLLCGCATQSQDSIGAAADSVGLATIDSDVSSPRLERAGFAVLDFRARRDQFGSVYVVGEVQNTGPGALGVELQASLRDADGRLTAVGHFYPASSTNIQPGETWPFAYSFGKQKEAVEAELRIVGAFRTMDVLGVASLP